MRRQAEALTRSRTDETGSEDDRLRVIAELDAVRSRLGRAPLRTESELHRKAKARGLITT
jgi:hypothetical protein